MTVIPKVRGERLEATGTPPGIRPEPGPRLVALTRDPGLVRALNELAAGSVPVMIVDDERSLTDTLMQHTSAIALLDAAALHTPVESMVDAISNQFPDLRLMVAGGAAEQNLLTTRISSLAVFRFVHKPASPLRLKLFLDAASRPTERRAVPRTGTPTTSPDRRAAGGGQTGGGKRALLAAAFAALVVLAVGAWWLLSGSDTKPPAADKAASASTTTQTPEISSLLQRADQAFAAGQFVAADGSSAAELYREALKLNARNQKAADGYRRAIDAGMQNAESALLEGKLEAAAAAAEVVRLIEPQNSRLAFLNTQIEREQGRLAADASQKASLEARQAQIQRTLALMQERLAQGALTEPATSNALGLFREAETISPADPAVRAAREALVAALLTAADRELDAGKPVAARQMLDAASSVNSSAPGLDVMRRRIADVSLKLTAASIPAAAPEPPPVRTAPQVQQAPVQQAPAPTPPRTAAPAVPAAPAAPAAVDSVVSASSLKLLRSTPPAYPEQALERLVSGWVELEFTVTKTGTVTDIQVLRGEPEGVFDAAASRSLRSYRYEPVVVDGVARDKRARLRMRFTAQDAR